MNLLRARIEHGDILTFMLRQRFITVVVRSMWYHHRRLSKVKWISCNGPRSYTGPLTHSQKHNAHTRGYQKVRAITL